MAKKRKVDQDPNSITSLSQEQDRLRQQQQQLEHQQQQRKEDAEDDGDDDEDEEKEEEQAEADAGEGEDEEEEDLAKTLEPFSKEQLIDLIRSAAAANPALRHHIRLAADSDPSHRKLFVHGLGWDTTSDTLRSFFSQFGHILDCNVVVDKSSGKSKGYGFLLFKRRRSALRALKNPQHKIDGRVTACQLASAGPVTTPSPSASAPHPYHHHHNQNQDVLARKIYVGNVHSEIPASKLLNFFSEFGEIEEGPLGFDRQTGKPKGFALFIYKTADGARKALDEPNKILDGHKLYCQKATDSHKLRGAVAAAPPAAPTQVAANPSPAPPSSAPQGFGAATMPDLAASAALLGQGLLAGALPPNQAALALLAAAGQSPAAFGVAPAMFASLNPALAAAAAAMNAAHPQPPAAAVGGQPAPAVPPVFGMASNVGYQQNMQGHQGVNMYHQNAAPPMGPVGQAPAPRPHSAVGHMGGYVAR